MTATPTIHVGDTVKRIQGRPSDVGIIGTVTWISDNNILGTAGDVMIKVQLANGTETTMYARQVRKVT